MKKGFTLVELLAVIVILAIIAIITIPMISNVIEKSKLGAMEDSAYGLIEAANYYYAEHMNEMSSNKLFVIENGIGTSEEKLNYKGKIEGNAKVLLSSNGKVALCLTNGKSYAKKEIIDSKVVMNTVSSDTTCEINGIDSDSDITIDISGSNSSYYNKNEIDDKLNDIRINISSLSNNVDELSNKIDTNKESIEALSENMNKMFNNSQNNIYIATPATGIGIKNGEKLEVQLKIEKSGWYLINFVVGHCGANAITTPNAYWAAILYKGDTAINAFFHRAAVTIPISNSWDYTATAFHTYSLSEGDYKISFINCTGVTTNNTYGTNAMAYAIRLSDN